MDVCRKGAGKEAKFELQRKSAGEIANGLIVDSSVGSPARPSAMPRWEMHAGTFRESGRGRWAATRACHADEICARVPETCG